MGIHSVHAEFEFPPHRRRNQFQNETGWTVVPYVYNLPGIGKGTGLLAAASNVGGSYTDLLGGFFFGDVNGQALGVNSVHIIPQHLIFDFGGVHLSRVTLQSYSQRGMNTDKKDYSLAEFGSTYFDGSRLTATFEDRRYELYFGYYGGVVQLTSLRDRDGNIILDANNAAKAHPGTVVLGTRLDLTDDYLDPRRGINIEPSFWKATPSAHGPDFYFLDTSVTGYIPVGKRSSWAFNFLRSDSHVIHKGETDPAALAREQGLDCSLLTDPSEKAQCQNFLNSIISENEFGTATSLGGTSRLRSYPEGRYKGAHTEFIGAEFRWNLTDEIKPFNIYLVKDVRTTVQVAFFYEVGTVADHRSDLWKITRSSYGTGFRVVTASGLVYRIDMAVGKEGAAPNIFFQYPWQI